MLGVLSRRLLSAAAAAALEMTGARGGLDFFRLSFQLAWMSSMNDISMLPEVCRTEPEPLFVAPRFRDLLRNVVGEADVLQRFSALLSSFLLDRLESVNMS